MFRRILYVAAVIAATACGGESDSVGPIDPSPPPPPGNTTLSVQIMGDPSSITNDGKLPVSASITPTTPPSDKIAWKLNGQAAGQGVSITVTLNPGDNQVCVDVTGAKGEVCKTYSYTPPVPTIACRLVVANAASEGLASPMHITFSKGSVTASRDVGLDGNCSVESPLKLEDSVLVDVSNPDGAPVSAYGRYYTATKADLSKELVLVLLPAVWQIQTGGYSGTSISIRPDLPFKAGSDGLGFWPRYKVSEGKYRYGTFGLSSALPFTTLALDKPEKISSDKLPLIASFLDSARVLTGWNIATAPVAKDTTLNSLNGILKIFMNSLDANGQPVQGADAFGSPYRSGTDIVGGTIQYVDEGSITLRITQHELVHTLGFGHGCAWHSVSNAFCDWLKDFPDYPNQMGAITATDVAYMQLMYRVNGLEATYGRQLTIGGTYAKYMGLAPESVVR